MASVPCTWPNGCANRTTHPSARCHHHRATKAVTATSGLIDAPPFGAVAGQPQRWRSQGQRVPAADRHVTFRPAVLAMIGGAEPELSTPTIAEIERATLALHAADRDGSTGGFTVPLLRTESAASSKVEHIEVGQRFVGRALAGLPTKQRSALEVAANVAAVRRALELADGPITPATFDDIHGQLMPDEDWAGRVRTVQNWIGGSDFSPRDARFVPPVPADVPAAMADLCVWVERTDVPAVAQAAIAHAHFESIHPYIDGNGRVGRALTHLVLRRRHVVRDGIAPISIAALADRAGYFDGLHRYEQGDVDGFVRWFARSCRTAAAASHQIQRGLKALRDEWHALPVVAGARADATIRKLVDQQLTHPVTSVTQAAQRCGVSHEAARGALERLADAGVLNRTTAARNLHIYEAHEVFALIDDLERRVASGVIG